MTDTSLRPTPASGSAPRPGDGARPGCSRRRVLAAGGLLGVGAVAGLAACSSPAPTGAAAAASPSPAASPGTSSGGATSGGAAGGSGGAAAGGTRVAALADVPVGGTLGVTVAGRPLLLSQPTAGQVLAFDPTCPHQGCEVAARSGAFACPCHGSTFSATGAVQHGPARTGLTPVPVTVSGDQIVRPT